MPQLTVAGRLLLAASCLIGFASVLWPTGPSNHTGGAKENSTSCPLGFTSSDGDKTPWRETIYSLHVAVGVPAFSAQHPSIGVGGRRVRPPDTRYHLYYNATIWTGEERPDALQGDSFADALLVREGGIVAVGSLAEVRRALPTAGGAPNGDARQQQQHSPGPAAAAAAAMAGSGEVLEHDMGGSFLMPGFVDAHVHLVPAGLSLGRVDLRGVASRTAFQQRVAARAAQLGPGEWLLGGQWDEGEWGGEMPTAHWLDQVCGGRPAYLTRHDLHMALANTAAMEAAGLGPHSPDPAGGIIDRDAATGRPTGLLRERAMALVEAAIPPPSATERRAAVQAASRLALSRGVTTLVDMGRYLAGDEGGPWEDLQEVYVPAADSGDLAVRVFAMVPLRSWRRLAAWVSVHGRAHPGGRLFWGGLKEFADGSLGSRTALLWEPYSDITDADSGGGGSPCCGQRGIADSELRELAAAAIKAGLQVAIHAIGDRAVDEVVAAYEAALDAALGAEEAEEEAKGGAADGRGGGERAERRRRLGQSLRLRVEHVQHLSGSDNSTAAMSRNGLTPVPNPLHLLTDEPMLSPRLGPARARRAFALASLRAAGLRPALASDWPVVDLQPLTGVYAAVHRRAPPPEAAAAAASGRKPARSGGDSDSVRLVGASGPDSGGSAAAAADGVEGAGGARREGRRGAAVAAEEALSLREALLGHTAWGAEAAGLEDYVGRLAPGLRADFVELSDSLAEEVGVVAGEVGAEGMGVDGAEDVGKAGVGGVGRGKGVGGRGGRRLRLSAERLGGCLPVVTRTWVDGELVYDRWAADGGHDVAAAEEAGFRD